MSHDDVPSLCGIRASVRLVHGPHDGKDTPAVFPLEAAPVEMDLPTHAGREVRYVHRESLSDSGGVALVYQFAGYV